MAAQKNLHVPGELLAQAQRLAELQGRTAGNLAADAVKRCLAHKMLYEFTHGAEQRRRDEGLKIKMSKAT
jgi:hypothetical protein